MKSLSKINVTAGKLWLVAIIALAFFVYAPALTGAFLQWDDNVQVPDNSDIRSLDFTGAKKIFSSYYAQMYQPLASLSFALEYRAAGLQTWPYHLDNILLHCLNILLVFWLTKKLWGRQEPALWTAALFAIWPTQVEAVAWISARSTLLSSGLILACLLSYLYFLDYKRKRFYWLSLLFSLLALLAKSSAVIVPLLLWLLDYWRQRRFSWRLLIDKLPFIALSVIFGLVAIAARQSVGTLTMSVYSWTDRLILILYTAVFQAYKALLPFGLYTYYQHPADSRDHLYWWVYLAALLPLLGALFVYLQRRHRWLVFAACWFGLNIALSIQLAPYITIAGADRYNYLAVLAVIWFITMNVKLHKSMRIILACLTLTLALAGWNLSYSWKNDLDLWQNVLDHDPVSAIAYTSRGQARDKEGDPLGGIDDLDISLALFPNQPEAQNIKGYIEMSSLKRFDWAARDFGRAIRLKQDSPVYFYNHGLAIAYLKKYDQAIADFSKAIELERLGRNNSQFLANANYSLAFMLDLSKNSQAAKAKALLATTLDPAKADAWYLLGLIKNKQAKNSGCPELARASALGFEPARNALKTCPAYEK